MGRLIDADRLLSYIADVQLSNAPDERDSEEVQKAQKEIYDMFEDFFKIVDEQPTAYDVDKVLEELEEITEFLKDCTKYGNKNAEQQKKSYDTMMMYEVADLVDDLLDIVRKGGLSNG